MSSEDPLDDPMAPPKESCECWCMHCGRVFMSTAMWFQRVVGHPDQMPGFWMCPTANCSGAGFTIDIFPTDPEHPENGGWYEDETDEYDPEAVGHDSTLPGAGDASSTESSNDPWDPGEAKWRELDDEFADFEDTDLEGEEWKLGLAPGERPPAADDDPFSPDEEDSLYDEPDLRPLELDWRDRETHRFPNPPGGETRRDDDIPF